MNDGLSVPPINQVHPLVWAKKNLFSTWYNSILTIISFVLIAWVASGFFIWALTEAQWGVITANLRLFFVGRYPVDLLWRTWTTLGIIVGLGGFSWGILSQTGYLWSRTSLIILGILAVTCGAIALPVGIQSSLLLLGMLILLVVGAFVGQSVKRSLPGLKTWLGLIWLVTFFVLLWLLQGGLFLRPVRLDDFSGLILTVLAAVVSIVLSFPFG
ncbi:MAG: amino acid ABC transporter permease, partial [Brasilonema sp.]